MTAISLAFYMEETLPGQEEKESVRCIYCGRGLTLFRRRRDGKFCSEEHRKRWHVERLARALATEPVQRD